MKHNVLIKTSRLPNIAHLYEHLYVMAITRQMRAAGLHLYVDYHSIARTYGSGFIYIELLLYSDDAARVGASIDSLRLPLDDESLRVALLQVVAEKRQEVRGDPKLVRRQLEELHAAPWQPLDEVDVLDARVVRRSQKGLRRLETPERQFRTTRCTLRLEEGLVASDRHLVALFHVVARVVLDNVVEALADTHGQYDSVDERSLPARGLEQVRILRQHRSASVDLRTELNTCTSIIREMIEGDFVAKLVQLLQSSSPGAFAEAVDIHRVYEATELLVGGNGWRSLATDENVQRVIEACSIQLRRGADIQVLALRGVQAGIVAPKSDHVSRTR